MSTALRACRHARSRCMSAIFLAPILLQATCLRAETAAVQTAAVPAAVSTGGYLQMVVGLAIVLGLVGGAAWLLKRLSALPGTGAGLIRVIGAAAVGQRERVVLVEVGDTWLLLGVAPGQVRRLHSMSKAESPAPAGVVVPADQGFSIWLRRMMEKRGHG
jgi:flagellar protein FliO/FliZ